MLVICINCRRIVCCSTAEGVPIDNCYHCHSIDCKEQIKPGRAIIAEVILSRFKDCLDHDSPHIGFKIGSNGSKNGSKT